MLHEELEYLIKEINNGNFYEVEELEYTTIPYVDEPTTTSLWANVGPCVASDLNVERHIWFDTSVNVYKAGNFFLGIRSVNTIYWEDRSILDTNQPLTAFEMVSLPSISFTKLI